MCNTGRSGALALDGRPFPSLPGSGRLDLERLVAARESPDADESPVVLPPDVGLHVALPLVHVVNVEAAGLATAEPRSARSRTSPRHDERARSFASAARTHETDA